MCCPFLYFFKAVSYPFDEPFFSQTRGPNHKWNYWLLILLFSMCYVSFHWRSRLNLLSFQSRVTTLRLHFRRRSWRRWQRLIQHLEERSAKSKQYQARKYENQYRMWKVKVKVKVLTANLTDKGECMSKRRSRLRRVTHFDLLADENSNRLRCWKAAFCVESIIKLPTTHDENSKRFSMCYDIAVFTNIIPEIFLISDTWEYMSYLSWIYTAFPPFLFAPSNY